VPRPAATHARGGRLTATDQRALSALNELMNELPDNTPVLYRGLSFGGDRSPQWDALHPGVEMEFKAPASTSTELETALKYGLPEGR